MKLANKYFDAARGKESTRAQKLTEILQQMSSMYQEYLQLKRRQVELLERSERAAQRYD